MEVANRKYERRKSSCIVKLKMTLFSASLMSRPRYAVRDKQVTQNAGYAVSISHLDMDIVKETLQSL